ncbi:OPT oligopeptide transporter protein-domain-containing protein [Myxozyma melibiosi]|uniref:OPT oligopeptide transporter protein-domain-containing protein n=1 Tax=Myxozyma melibiosi TaxID=54550 RepID=A0ABR1EXN6_9ASCO
MSPSDSGDEKIVLEESNSTKGFDVDVTPRLDKFDAEFITQRIIESDELEYILAEDASFITSKVSEMGLDKALAILASSEKFFRGDMNFPQKAMSKIQLLLQGEEAYGQGPDKFDLDARLEATMIKYHSPYPEVRSVCSPVDDPTIVSETFRVYLIAGVWTAISSFVNTMIAWRQPHFSLSSQVIQLFIVPTAQAFAYIVPNWRIKIGKYGFYLNPGPWTVKEQTLATIIVNAGASQGLFLGYAPILQLDLFYGLSWMSYGYNCLISLSCQFMGLAMAGLMRRWVLYPVKALWPTILPTLQLNRTLLVPEKKANINGWTMSKYKFFNILLAASFVYFFIPNYLFTALSTFNWPTWIAPDNRNLAFVMGSKIGMGFNPITTFDWSVINLNSPLVVPFYTLLNPWIGTFIGAFIILGFIYSNYSYTGYLPPNLGTIYDRYRTKYNTTKVLTDGYFDLEKYKAYSPPFITAGYMVLQGADYTLTTFGFVYIVLSEWQTIRDAAKDFYNSLRKRTEADKKIFKDPMVEMMQKYDEVPDLWYFILFILCVGVGVICIRVWDTELPVWAYFVVLAIVLTLLLPSMMLYASTGYMYSMALLATLLGGYFAPGSGTACIFTRIYGFGIDTQTETYVGDQKMGHYAKIPPRAVFRAQVFATLIQVFVSCAGWEALKKIPDLCSVTQASKFTCPFAHTMYSQSILFGIIGPTRTFDKLYPFLKWCFLLGAGLAVPCWALRQYFPRQLHYWQPVLILAGIARYGSSYNLSYYTPGLIMSFIFMYYVRSRFPIWWAKYNYIMSSGLTAGTAFSAILIFFALQYHPKTLSWWGNNVSSAGVDGKLVASVELMPAVGYFGPEAGSWD